MELRQLKYFAEIAAAGSLREASARLHVAQPALTRHLRALEDELGVQLCARHARGVRLTPAGSRFLDRATSILRQVGDIRSRLSEDIDSPAGMAAIGASGAMGRLLFGAVAEKIARDFPRIALSMVEGGAYTLMAALDARRIDMALMVNPDARAGFTLEPLITEPVYLIGGASDGRLEAGSIGMSALESLPLATFERVSGPRKIFDRAAAEAGIALNIAYEVESLDVIKDFVRRGLAFALLPHSSIVDELKDRSFGAARLERIGITRALVMREELMEHPVSGVVAQIVRDEIGSLISAGTFGSPAGPGTDRPAQPSSPGPSRKREGRR